MAREGAQRARRALFWHRAWVVRPLNLRDPSRATHLPFFTRSPPTLAPPCTRTCHPRLLPPQPRSRSERASPESGISGSLHAPGGAVGASGRVPSSRLPSPPLGAQRHPLCHPALGPCSPWWRPGPHPRVARRLPCGPLTSGILLGRAVCTETPNTHSLRRSQLRPTWQRPAGTKAGRRTGSGRMLHTFVQRRSCLPQGRPA